MLTGRLLAGTPIIDCPRMRMSPEVGCSNPAIMRIRVVLPQPEGPRIEKNSPGATLNVTSSTAAWLPKRLVTLTISRSVEEAMTLPRKKSSPGKRTVRKSGAGYSLTRLFGSPRTMRYLETSIGWIPKVVSTFGSDACRGMMIHYDGLLRAGLQTVEDLALDLLDAGRHGRIPLDVVDGGLREALGELVLQLALHELVGAVRSREVAGGRSDFRGDLRLHVEVDPLVGG